MNWLILLLFLAFFEGLHDMAFQPVNNFKFVFCSLEAKVKEEKAARVANSELEVNHPRRTPGQDPLAQVSL